jgi:hypothetical protein
VVAGGALALSTAAGPRAMVARSRGEETEWLLGPLAGAGVPPVGASGFSLLVLAMALAYLVAIREAPRLSAPSVAAAVVVLHLLFALAPPLLSPDVFGYLGFARLEAVHGLDPYVSAATAIRADPVYPYVGWKAISSPYGPLFTLGSYPIGLLGLPAGLWAYKLLALAASLGCVALVHSSARALGREPLGPALFMGLNPLVLVWGVGGAHNDLLAMCAALAGVRLAVAGQRWPRAGGLMVAAAGVKASAGLLVPFLVMASPSRARVLLAVASSAGAVGLATVAAFGVDGLTGYLAAVIAHGRKTTIYSLPHHLGLMLGFERVPTALRMLGLATFVGVSAGMLRATARGSTDWISAAGWSTLALLATTTWILPWYLLWLLPLAALGASRALRCATLALCAFVLVTRLPLLMG